MNNVRELVGYKKNDGRISPKALVWILVLFSVLYSGYKLSYPYFSYYMIRTDVKEEVKLSYMYTDKSLRKRIAKKALTWSIPVTAEDVVISRDFDRITISMNYSETITFFGRYKKTLVFKISESGPIKDHVGVLR